MKNTTNSPAGQFVLPKPGRHRSRRFLLPVIAGCLLLFTHCGGGGGSTGGTAPTISNFQYSPSVEYLSTTPMSFTGSFSFWDSDGDLSSATLTIADSSGATISTTTEPIQGAAGQTSGVLNGSVTALVPVVDNYAIRVFVTDSRGLQSNVLSGSVRIVRSPWTSKQASSISRTYAAVAVVNGRLYVLGGQLTDTGTIPGPATAAVEVYDPQTDSWSTSPSMPTARMGLVAAEAGGKLYAIGGSINGYSMETGAVEEFDPGTQTWTTRASMTTPRCFAAGALVGGRIYVMGGRKSGDVAGRDVAEVYDPATDSWSSVAPMPTGRSDLAAAESNGRLYVAGGYAGLMTQWIGTLEAYNPTDNSWSARNSMHTPRSHLALAAVAGKVLAAGGENLYDRSLDTLQSYDPSANAWSVKTPSPVAFTGATAGVVNGKMYVFGKGLTLEYDPAYEIR